MSQVRMWPHVPHVDTKVEQAGLADVGPRYWARQTDRGAGGGPLYIGHITRWVETC